MQSIRGKSIRTGLGLGALLTVAACTGGKGDGGDVQDEQGDGDGDGDGDTDGGTTDGGTTDGGTTDGAELTECDHLIDCAKLAEPSLVSTYTKLYGLEGECYSLPGLTPEDCWAECAALLEGLALVHPEVAECGPPNCGDGKLDPDEMCDGGPGCLGTCIFDDSPFMGEANGCNPVNGVGCTADERCELLFGNDGSIPLSWFACFAGGPNDVPLGGECVISGSCSDLNALCLALSQDCNNGCCTATCYLGATDQDYGCMGGLTCVSVTELGGMWPEGSELFGICV